MTFSRTQLAVVRTPLWFCLRAQPKREHLAALGLRRQLNVPCYAPRLRFRKMTRRGAVWFVEAMFPAYSFRALHLFGLASARRTFSGHSRDRSIWR